MITLLLEGVIVAAKGPKVGMVGLVIVIISL